LHYFRCIIFILEESGGRHVVTVAAMHGITDAVGGVVREFMFVKRRLRSHVQQWSLSGREQGIEGNEQRTAGAQQPPVWIR